MPVKDNAKANEESATVAEAVGDQIDLTQLPGFHVTRKDDGLHLGTYGTREDAEAYIAGHLDEQGVDAEIVEGANS
jgi:hypothetical protein